MSNQRLKLINWIAKRVGINEAQVYPKWLLVMAYMIMPEQIPIARAVSPIKYDFLTNCLKCGDVNISVKSLLWLAKAKEGTRFTIISRDGTITIRREQDEVVQSKDSTQDNRPQ